MCSTFPFVSRINIQPDSLIKIQPDSLIKIQPDSLMCLMFTKSHDPVQFLWKYFTWTFCKQRFLANLSWIIWVNECPSCCGYVSLKYMQTTKSCKVYQPLKNWFWQTTKRDFKTNDTNVIRTTLCVRSYAVM